MNHQDKPEKTLLFEDLTFFYPNITLDSLQAVEKQSSHQHCMLCGTQPLLGLHLHFYSGTDQLVWARAKGTIHHQGYQGILHGGFLSALLDSGMCQALFQQKIEAVTADMSIRYLHEVPVNSEILIKGEITSARPPLYKVSGELYVQGKLMVKSSARFMTKGFGKKINVS
ncbi:MULTISPECIES: PaaI family thioesterase [Shewanella]|uniref:Acyl-coenzyme A thioesterase THEM4 n=1 Tax=Shewanella polaris TaxID=2588449 RepID=A0A4Y5YCH4_9GAMM|nr:PaaI family thioesterase [Shewanella polaris]QDE30206.1 PaaI family thioesterase [Shewanella polaris]